MKKLVLLNTTEHKEVIIVFVVLPSLTQYSSPLLVKLKNESFTLTTSGNLKLLSYSVDV